MKIRFIIVSGLFLIAFNIKPVVSQNSICDYLYNKIPKTSDSIGKYDINTFVVGVVEIDSLVQLSYEFTIKKGFSRFKYYSYFITNKRNIDLQQLNTSNIDNLIYQKDYFDLEVDVNVIKIFIYPKCNDSEKLLLDKAFKNSKDCRLKINLQDNVKIDDKLSYKEITYPKKFLLVIMNRTWRQNLYFVENSTKDDNSNTYIKYLIPLSN